MASNDSNRIRKADFEKTLSRKARHLLSNKIQQIKSSKQGLSTNFLNKILFHQPHFIGVFPQDYLLHVSFVSFPVSLVLNLDVSSQSGSHWIAIYITDTHLEIFDSFGLDSTTWSRKPIILLRFIEKLSQKRKVVICPRLQSDASNFCGVYSIFFLLLRQNNSFESICKLFSHDFNLNDSILYSFLK